MKTRLLIVLTGAMFMIMVDQTIVAIGLPSIGRDLNMSTSALTWVVNAYIVAIAAAVTVAGRLGDRFGRRNVFCGGVVLFTLASLAGGLAPDPATLLIARALEGVGAAAMIPTSTALIMNTFKGDDRVDAMARFSGLSKAGVAVGPLLGGLLVGLVSWRMIFLINVPVGIVTVLALVLFTERSDEPRSEDPIGWGGAALAVVAIAGVVFGVESAPAYGWLSFPTIAALVIGVAVGVVFVITQLRSDRPLMPVALLNNRRLAVHCAIGFAFQAGFIVLMIYGAVYLQSNLGLSVLVSGVAMLPLIVPVVVSPYVAAWLFKQGGALLPIALGLGLSLVGVLIWIAMYGSLDYWVVAPALFVAGCGLGLIITPSMTDALNSVGGHSRGAASGMLTVTRNIGGALGLAAITTITVAAGGSIEVALIAAAAVFAAAIGISALLATQRVGGTVRAGLGGK